MRGVMVRGVRVRLIRDTTCIPHNGCRAPQDRQC
jgi:ribosomal protein S11